MFRYFLFFLLLTIFLFLIYATERLLLSDDFMICMKLTDILLVCE